MCVLVLLLLLLLLLLVVVLLLCCFFGVCVLLLLLLFRECGTYGDGALVTLATPGVGLAVLGDLNTAFPTQSPVSGEQDTARVSVSSREVTLQLPPRLSYSS